MKYTPLFSCLALGLTLAAQAQECPVDLNVESAKFRCSESLDSSGCNAGRVTLRVRAASACKDLEAVEVTCESRLQIRSRGNAEGTTRLLSQTEILALEDGHADAKIFMTLNSLIDPMYDIKIVESSCRTASAPRAENVSEPEKAPMPEPLMQSVPKAPQAPVREIVIVPEPKPEPVVEAAPKSAHDEELELLREQNRAKELEIKALELKIKLKEMER